MLKEVKEMLDEVRRKIQEITDNIKSIKEALYDSGWIEATGNLGTKVKYRKKNGWVSVHITTGTSNIPANTGTKVFTMPEGFRPTSVPSSLRLASDAAGGARYTSAWIESGGAIYIYQTAASAYFNVMGSFPVGGGYFLTLLRILLRGGVCYA